MRTALQLLALAGVALAASAPASAAAACPGDTAALTSLTGDVAQGVLLCSINGERAAAGLRPVVLEGHLQRAAQAHGADMVARRFFAHTTPDGRTLARRIRAAGYFRDTIRWTVGEAIGWAPPSVATAAALTQAWMNSPPHREILLDRRFRELGIGVAAGAPDPAGLGATAVLDFGRRTLRRSLRAWPSRTACASTPRTSSRTRARCASTSTRSRP
jgi:uncharacterized protein YkwD